jgi:hypothetical protein
MKYYMYDGMVACKINKRSYEEELYRQGLNPDMDPLERALAIRKYLFRRDEDVLKAMVDRNDEESRREAFVRSIYNAITTDKESLDKKGMAIWNALASNNAEELLIALCGYGSTSLAKRAMIIPDDAEEFYNSETPATIIVYWSNGEISEGKCRIDAKTNKVYGYKRNVFSTYEGSATVRWVAVKVKTCFGRDSYLRWCITEDQRNQTGDYVSYWYSTDAESDQCPEPDEIIENPYR